MRAQLFRILRPYYRIMANLNDTQDSLSDLKISGIRSPYSKTNDLLDEKTIQRDPFNLFREWLNEAAQIREIHEPNAMCLATANKNGIPSARYVLLKYFTREGFVFFTNYNSRKGQEIKDNPNVAAVFYWESLSKSIRIEGLASKVSEEQSDTYFGERPIPNQIGALSSEQSSTIPNRELLEKKKEQIEKAVANGSKLSRPKNWGGYIILPERMEFWQGQSNRLHDRILFRKKREGEEPDGVMSHSALDGWIMERLSP